MGDPFSRAETCDDADDVFVDRKHHRLYVSHGEGIVEVLESGDAGYRRVARVPRVSGARTSLVVSYLDGLLVAGRAGSNEPAAIRVFWPAR